jgi:hypothetical protein
MPQQVVHLHQGDPASGPQELEPARQDRPEVREVSRREARPDPVDRVESETGDIGGVSLNEARARDRSAIRLGQKLRVGVHADDLSASGGQHRGLVPEGAAEIEHPLTRAQRHQAEDRFPVPPAGLTLVFVREAHRRVERALKSCRLRIPSRASLKR